MEVVFLLAAEQDLQEAHNWVAEHRPGKEQPFAESFPSPSSALVLFMTLPGLALFYGGLVRKKNALSVLAQCLGITGLVTILQSAAAHLDRPCFSLVRGLAQESQSPSLRG
jgi:hypothetical protein